MPAERKLRSVLRFLLRLLPVLILAAGVTFFHWRGLQPGYTFLPVDLAKTILPWGDGAPRVLQNWLISDPLYQFYPFLAQAVDNVRQGQWLLWDPGIMLGHPAAADPLFQTFYPGVLPFGLLFGAGRGYGIALYVHALLAALLMYGFLRALRISAPAAVAGAFTYALSGYLVTWFEFSFWLTTLAWLPGVLWAYVLAVRKGSWRYVALGGLCLGLALLAGQLQFVVIFGGFFLAGALAYALLARRDEARKWWPLVAAAGSVGLGGLVGAVQVVMTADFLPLTTRTAGYGGSGLPFAQLTALLLPNFFGNPSRSDYWGAGNFNETTIYVGIVAVFLAALAFARFRRLPLSALIAGATALVLLYLMIGGPGTGLLQFLPVISQAPLSRFAFLLPLLVGWLAAVMMDDAGLSTRQVVVAALVLVIAAGVMAAIFWNPGIANNVHLLREDAVVALLLVGTAVAALIVRIRAPRYHTAANWTIAALVFANLAWFGRTYNPAGKVEDLFPVDTTVQPCRSRRAANGWSPCSEGRCCSDPTCWRGLAWPSPAATPHWSLHAITTCSRPPTPSWTPSWPAAPLTTCSSAIRRRDCWICWGWVPWWHRRRSLIPAPTRSLSVPTVRPPRPPSLPLLRWRAPSTCGARLSTASICPLPRPKAKGRQATWSCASGAAQPAATSLWRSRLPVTDVLSSPQQVVYFGAQPDAPGPDLSLAA